MPQFTPQFDEGLQGYAWKQAYKNHWKVRNTHEVEDLFQEYSLVFVDAVHRYKEKATNQQHFMALYKACIFTHTVDLARVATKEGTAITESDLHDAEGEAVNLYDSAVGEADNVGEFLQYLTQAPENVKRVLDYVFGTPAAALLDAEVAWKAKGRKKVMGNTYLCHQLGIKDPYTINVEQETRKFLTA